MKRAVLKLPVKRSLPELEYGIVSRADEGGFHVDLDGVEFLASVAFSCLVAPVAGDMVLCVTGGRETAFILAVLERRNGAAEGTNLNFTGDVDLTVHGGSLRIRAEEQMEIAAQGCIAAVASSLDLKVASVGGSIEKAKIEGKILESSFEEIHTLAGKCIETFGFVSQKSNNSVRMVNEHDELQAGSIRYLAEGTMTVQARDIMQTAEENVRIDAEKIHLG